MRTTMDKAGRIVIPASIREQLGMVAGPVDIHVNGTGVQIEVPAADNLVETADGRLIIRASGTPLTDEQIRELRLAHQR